MESYSQKKKNQKEEQKKTVISQIHTSTQTLLCKQMTPRAQSSLENNVHPFAHVSNIKALEALYFLFTSSKSALSALPLLLLSLLPPLPAVLL